MLELRWNPQDESEFLHAGMLRQAEALTVTEAKATERDTAAKVFPRTHPAISAPRAASPSEVAYLGSQPPPAPQSRARAPGNLGALGPGRLPAGTGGNHVHPKRPERRKPLKISLGFLPVRPRPPIPAAWGRAVSH